MFVKPSDLKVGDFLIDVRATVMTEPENLTDLYGPDENQVEAGPTADLIVMKVLYSGDTVAVSDIESLSSVAYMDDDQVEVLRAGTPAPSRQDMLRIVSDQPKPRTVVLGNFAGWYRDTMAGPQQSRPKEPILSPQQVGYRSRTVLKLIAASEDGMTYRQIMENVDFGPGQVLRDLLGDEKIDRDQDGVYRIVPGVPKEGPQDGPEAPAGVKDRPARS